MKRFVLICLCCLHGLCGFSQQTPKDYYKGRSSIIIWGMMYKCEAEFGRYSLSRFDNTKIGERMVYKDGTPAPAEAYAYCEGMEDTITFWNRVRAIFRNYRQELKNSGECIKVDYILIPTGHITEVRITFNDTPLLCSIPPQTYVALEQAIRTEVVFKWGEHTKELYDWLPGFMMVCFGNPAF